MRIESEVFSLYSGRPPLMMIASGHTRSLDHAHTHSLTRDESIIHINASCKDLQKKKKDVSSPTLQLFVMHLHTTKTRLNSRNKKQTNKAQQKKQLVDCVSLTCRISNFLLTYAQFTVHCVAQVLRITQSCYRDTPKLRSLILQQKQNKNKTPQ